MAKTTSEIQAENKQRNDDIQEVIDTRNAINQKQLEGISEESAAKTQAILDQAYSSKNTESEPITFNYSQFAFCIIGMIIGLLVASVFFKIKIKKIKQECETRVNEARAALDRMLVIASKDTK